jgi:hypothetical protein
MTASAMTARCEGSEFPGKSQARPSTGLALRFWVAKFEGGMDPVVASAIEQRPVVR